MLRRRHLVIGIRRENALDDFAFVRFAGNNGDGSFAIRENSLFRVEAHLRFARRFIRPVAMEATVGKNRSDVAGKIDRAGLGVRVPHRKQSLNQQNAGE